MEHDPVIDRAVTLAARLAEAALEVQTADERAEGAQMARMMADPAGKAFTLAMADRVFRSRDPRRQAKRVRDLIDRYGTPDFLPAAQRLMLAAGAAAAPIAPAMVMAGMEAQLRRSAARVILDADPERLAEYLERRRAAGTRVNLNHLGEAVLGEREAHKRLAAIINHLRNPLVDYISVKISAIYSQVNVLDFAGTLTIIKDRLRRLYRAAMPQGKFVNLDMEEYRDLHLTLAAFQQVLDEPEFLRYSAGVVLQAYLPDSWSAQQQLVDWAKRRVALGGVPIKMRLVKGANLAMEHVEAELHHWNPAPYGSKAETDANFRRMLELGCRAENASAVRLGVATHNLFDAALALVLRDQPGVAENVEIEMLEGMANHQARAVQRAAGGLLVYAPAVARDDFLSALAYLVRRLDENTAPQNFLHDMFGLKPGTDAWEKQQARFVAGWNGRNTVPVESRRACPLSPVLRGEGWGEGPNTDGRPSREPVGGETIGLTSPSATSPRCIVPDVRPLTPSLSPEYRGEGAMPSPPAAGAFRNAPDTDWTQAPARAALADAVRRWTPPAVADHAPLEEVMSSAVAAQLAWEALGAKDRGDILRRAAGVMNAGRFDTIALMMHEGKKAAYDGDIEVAEAVDFANYAAATASPLPEVVARALGVVVITPPWNFPYAIPCGGVTAALAVGNSVILKPAPQTVAIAQRLAEQLWEAGVPRDVLHFFPCPDGPVGKALLTDPRTAAVVLTGACETARMFQSWRPSMRLSAETSGKNAIVITSQADRDLAIKDLVRSAFGHAGQKCSAASLAILDTEVYDDPSFRRALRDAASSLRVGPATDLGSVVTPLIDLPSPNLRRALTTLEPGEEWLLQPRVDAADPCLWSPGIKLGVQRGSWFHQTECFGPVLGLMRAESLDEAIAMQNETPFGLTAGIHSLDASEVRKWEQSVRAGNLYVNRPITGAIVRRQPFGGWKRSSIGVGAKAGGENYTMSFAHLTDANPHSSSGEAGSVAAARDGYHRWWKDHFAVDHDPSALTSESNRFRYRRCRGVILRVDPGDEVAERCAVEAASVCGVPLTISRSDRESEEALIARLPSLAEGAEFLRTLRTPGDALLRAAYDAGLNWINAPILRSGRYELPRWLREQSFTETRHRYGLIAAEGTGRDC